MVRFVVVALVALAAPACHRRPKPAGPPGDCAAVAEALASLDLGN
jgi:hypothetical protein